MGKEDDSLLRFLSMEKPRQGSSVDIEKTSHEQQQQQATAMEAPRHSYPIVWTVLATFSLVLMVVTGAFQFCRERGDGNVSLHGTNVRRPFQPHRIPYYEVPLRVVPASHATRQAAAHGIPSGRPGFLSRGFEFTTLAGEMNSHDFHPKYEGLALLHEGRAYLTSQLSSDDQGVVARSHSVGRLLHSQMVRMKHAMNHRHEAVVSFRTSFVFSIENSSGDREATGDGFAFVMVPEGSEMGSAGGSLGVLNLPKEQHPHTFAVEFDTWKNPALRDINNNHVGINVGSMVSLVAADAGYWTSTTAHKEGFRPLDLTTGKIQAWVDYDGEAQELSVSISPVLGRKPAKPLLKQSLDLSKVLDRYMFVGFSAATGDFAAKHVIHSWQFEKCSSELHWLENVKKDESSRDHPQWQSATLHRDQVSGLPVFRNPRRPRHGSSMRRQSTPTLPAVARVEESRPVRPMMTMKSCTHWMRDFPRMHISAFKEHLLHRWLWILAGFVSGLLFFRLLYVTCRALLGCYHGFWSERSERSEYFTVLDDEKKKKEAGYVLVVSDEQLENQHLARG